MGKKARKSWLVGYVNYQSGIGEDIRTTQKSLESNGIRTAIINYMQASSNLDRYLEVESTNSNCDKPYDLSIVCLTAEETMRLSISNEGYQVRRSKYIIGYWPWELPIWPEIWIKAIDFVDEIWVSTRYIKSSLEKTTNKPVLIMPLCVEPPEGKYIPLEIKKE